jgi:hypothetical protein
VEQGQELSYCRFGEADAYIFDHAYEGLVCMGCTLMPYTDDDLMPCTFIAGYDRQKMLDHIAEHRYIGDRIPFEVDERLREEMKHDDMCLHRAEIQEILNPIMCTYCQLIDKVRTYERMVVYAEHIENDYHHGLDIQDAFDRGYMAGKESAKNHICPDNNCCMGSPE